MGLKMQFAGYYTLYFGWSFKAGNFHQNAVKKKSSTSVVLLFFFLLSDQFVFAVLFWVIILLITLTDASI